MGFSNLDSDHFSRLGHLSDLHRASLVERRRVSLRAILADEVNTLRRQLACRIRALYRGQGARRRS